MGGWLRVKVSRHTFGTNAHLILCIILQKSLDTTTWELEDKECQLWTRQIFLHDAARWW